MIAIAKYQTYIASYAGWNMGLHETLQLREQLSYSWKVVYITAYITIHVHNHVCTANCTVSLQNVLICHAAAERCT